MSPYVVSADVYLLLKTLAEEKNLTLPPKNFFVSWRQEFVKKLEQTFPVVEFVPETELVDGLCYLAERSKLPVVSLDRVYLSTPLHLDIARVVDKNGKNLGLRRRVGEPNLLNQILKLKESGLNEIALADDVIFSGSQIERLATTLKRVGITVRKAYAGIVIEAGKQRLHDLRIEVEQVRLYQQVVDEVCERDFFPGVPYSGRLVAGGEDVGIPYILPFGQPTNWASIPKEFEISFSKFCLEQTIELFKTIEQASKKTIHCSEIGRRPIGVECLDYSFVSELQRLLSLL